MKQGLKGHVMKTKYSLMGVQSTRKPACC